MGPTPERVVTIARDRVARLFVQRERKVLAVVDDHLEALVIDDCPVADISVKVGSQIGKIESHKESVRDIY